MNDVEFPLDLELSGGVDAEGQVDGTDPNANVLAVLPDEMREDNDNMETPMTIDTTMLEEVQQFISRVENIMAIESDNPYTDMGPKLLAELDRLPRTRDIMSHGLTFSRMLKVAIIYIAIYNFILGT